VRLRVFHVVMRMLGCCFDHPVQPKAKSGFEYNDIVISYHLIFSPARTCILNWEQMLKLVRIFSCGTVQLSKERNRRHILDMSGIQISGCNTWGSLCKHRGPSSNNSPIIGESPFCQIQTRYWASSSKTALEIKGIASICTGQKSPAQTSFSWQVPFLFLEWVRFKVSTEAQRSLSRPPWYT
jgi:hypothetical protein